MVTRPHGKVLIIVENLSVPFDRRVWSEATALFRNGYEVSVICPKGENATRSFETIDGIHIYRHWVPRESRGITGYFLEYGTALFWEFTLSVRVLLTRGFDVIHACNPPDLLFLIGIFYKVTLGKRFLFDHHDLSPELYEAKFHRRDLLWVLLVLLERLTFRAADVSIATNESFRSIAVERGKMRPDRVFVVRTGPNLSRIHSLPADQAWKKGRRFLVVYVGNIGNQDGLDLLIDAAVHILRVRKRNDIHFAIVGDGAELDNIIALSNESGIDDAVTFVGRVDDDQTLCTILSTADVCVNPDVPNAVNDRSTTIKIMEYMAVGKPIVQFDLKEGRNSALVASLYARNDDTADFGDKIIELLDNPEKSKKMGAFGRERVEQVLAWEHEEKRLLESYKVIFGNRPNAPKSQDVTKLVKVHSCKDIEQTTGS